MHVTAPDPDPVIGAAWRRYGRIVAVSVGASLTAAAALFWAGGAYARLGTVEVTVSEHAREITELKAAVQSQAWNMWVICKSGNEPGSCQKPPER